MFILKMNYESMNEKFISEKSFNNIKYRKKIENDFEEQIASVKEKIKNMQLFFDDNILPGNRILLKSSLLPSEKYLIYNFGIDLAEMYIRKLYEVSHNTSLKRDNKRLYIELD
jgi:hypothetical protein